MSEFLRAVNRLYSGPRNIKYDLDRIIKLTNLLGRPQESFRAFHVAGTNGKGSTCAFISQILTESKISHGFSISPHLVDIRERIRINNKNIPEQEFIYLESEIFRASKGLEPSFFEKLTAMWMLAFARAGVPYAVVEVGLGGRLDCSNIVNPIVCGITSISKDHCHILGNTLGEIAKEKAGIIKNRIPTITGRKNLENLEISKILKACAISRNAELYCADPVVYDLNLKGEHQKENAGIAAKIVEVSGVLDKLDNKKNIIRTALEKTKWPGRYELVSKSNEPIMILDGAHNVDAARVLVETLKQDERLKNAPAVIPDALGSRAAGSALSRGSMNKLKPMILILGFSKNHDPKEFLQEFKDFDYELIIPETQHELLQSSSEVATKLGLKKFKSCNLEASMNLARQKAQKTNSFILITGSLYLLGEYQNFYGGQC